MEGRPHTISVTV